MLLLLFVCVSFTGVLWNTVEGCMCWSDHNQNIFCSQGGFVLRGTIVSRTLKNGTYSWQLPGSVYRVRIKQMFKPTFWEPSNKFEDISTSDHLVGCGEWPLDVGTEYLLTGNTRN